MATTATEFIYIIHPQRRVKNSPFFLEGTKNTYDLPDEYPIPNQCTIMEKADKGGGLVARVIRYIPQCPTIYKDEQIKQGWPQKYRLKGNDKRLLTFKQGKLTVKSTDKTRLDYLDKAGYNADIKAENRYHATQIIYQKFDPEAEANVALQFEDLVTNARNIVKNLEVDQAKQILRLHTPTRSFSSQTSLAKYKLELNQLAATNPEFIINAIKGTEMETKIMLSKAVEYRIIDLMTPGKLRVRHPNEEKWEEAANIPDIGGAANKFDKALNFFKTEKGQAWVEQIKTQVEAHEKSLVTE